MKPFLGVEPVLMDENASDNIDMKSCNLKYTVVRTQSSSIIAEEEGSVDYLIGLYCTLLNIY